MPKPAIGLADLAKSFRFLNPTGSSIQSMAATLGLRIDQPKSAQGERTKTANQPGLTGEQTRKKEGRVKAPKPTQEQHTPARTIDERPTQPLTTTLHVEFLRSPDGAIPIPGEVSAATALEDWSNQLPPRGKYSPLIPNELAPAYLWGTTSSRLPSNRLAIEKLVQDIAECKAPSLQRGYSRGFRNGVHVLVDEGATMRPFYRDTRNLIGHMKRIIGPNLLSVQHLNESCDVGLYEPRSDLVPTSVGTTVVILTDLRGGSNQRWEDSENRQIWTFLSSARRVVVISPYARFQRSRVLPAEADFYYWGTQEPTDRRSTGGDLARHLSVAGILDPDLIRSMRRKLFPKAEAGLEGDMLLGPSVTTFNSRVVALDSSFVRSARAELSQQPGVRETAQAFRSLSEYRRKNGTTNAVGFEERLVAAVVSGRHHETRGILLSLLRTLLESIQRAGINRWALSILDELPIGSIPNPLVQQLRTAIALRLGNSSTIPTALEDQERWLLPDEIDFAVTWVDGQLTFSEDTEGYRAALLSTPSTTPRHLEIRDLSGTTTPIQIWPGRDLTVPGLRLPLEIRTLSGATFRISELTSRQQVVDAYLAKVARDHESLIPLFDRRQAPLVDQIYVELKLRDDERFASLGETKGHLPGRSMTIQEVLDLDPAEHPWITRRWVVLGDPGAGKTTLLRHLTRKLALDEGRTLVPVLETLPRLLREKAWMLDRLEAQLTRDGEKAEGLAEALDQLGRRGELVVQLDGLDEVPRGQKEAAASLLRRLSVRWPTTPILVTSRPVGYHHPGEGFHELEVQRFDGTQRLDFLIRWLGDDRRARKALAAIDTDRAMRDLAGNPLYLTLMAILVEQGVQPSENRVHLYDQIFKLLFEGRHQRPAQPMPLMDDCRKTLRQLAFAMTVDGLQAEPVDQIERRFWSNEDLRQAAQPMIAHWGDVRPFLDDLAEKTGIIGPLDGADADWRYWHRSFQEALTSEVLAQKYQSGGQAAVLEAAAEIEGDEGRWAEAFVLLTGQVDEPDALIKALVETNRALGLRALASAPVLNNTTINEVLALTDDLEKRAQVLLQIPEFLPDAPTALALIDRLRLQTRSGNDLCLLDFATDLVARKPDWADYARVAQQLRDRLYDHLPPPPVDLFEAIETQVGRVAQWSKVPAGRFLLGSPDGEEGRWNDEGPQHEVVIGSDFWLAAVPVTQAQFAAFEPDHRSLFQGDQRPVDNVTWFQAMAFCGWLERRDGLKGARLPTEEEWEFACRAGTTSRYWSGESESDLKRVGWYDQNSGGQTHPVGEKQPNAWGLYEVHGNVYEWTASPWTGDYSERPNPNLVDPGALLADLARHSPLATRVFRGGSCGMSAQNARSAFREGRKPWIVGGDLGFRVLLPQAPTEQGE